MRSNYSGKLALIFGGLIVLLSASCKKNDSPAPVSGNFATLGLYEASSGSSKRIYIPITKLGDKSIAYLSIFDTGSAGMTIDANGILPASMITSTGITVPGDSVVVNGITVTSKTAVMSYGDATTTVSEYGNLAYAPVTIGDQNGTITTSRIPFFIYYKVKNITTGEEYPTHSSDVFGVGPGVNFASSKILSPLSYFGNNDITSGFKLATLNSGSLSVTGTYVSDLLTIGLTPADLSTSGFIMHPLSYSVQSSYSPNIPATLNYNGQNIAATILFDSGTPSATIIEDRAATSTRGALPANTLVTLTTNRGFIYQYTTSSTANLTQVQNPNISGDYRTIFSIDFFIHNEFLLDYKNHQIGLKNN